jgi:hypothetical protein
VTVIVAFIVGWISQWYAYVPGVANVKDMLAPAPIGLQSNEVPSSAVAVWVVASWLVQVTVVPAGTESVAGENAKPAMVTVCVPVAPSVQPPAAVVAVAAGVPASVGEAVSLAWVAVATAAVGVAVLVALGEHAAKSSSVMVTRTGGSFEPTGFSSHSLSTDLVLSRGLGLCG